MIIKLYESFKSLMNLLSKAMAIVSAVGLFLITLLIVVDVFMRFLFSKPIVGNWELVGTILVLSTFWSLTYCLDQKGHVRIEVIIDHCPRLFRDIMRIVGNIIGIVAFYVICWQAIMLAIKYASSTGRISETLHIPTAYLMLIMAIGAGVFVLKLLCEFIDAVAQFFSGLRATGILNIFK